jgi:uncharacterized protein YjiK
MITSFIKCKSILRSKIYYALTTVLFFVCCNNNTMYTSPLNYQLNNPYVIKLPAELKEISGITYYPKDNSLFAECDDKGCLYKISLNKLSEIKKWKFSHKRDYEDIALCDSTFYMLNSNGDIISVNFVQDSLVEHEHLFPEKGSNEFESLYYDDQLKKLVLICKDCESGQPDQVSAYTFDPESFTYSSSFAIDVGKIRALIGPGAKFKPSGATINPATGEIYIISSTNKLLVVTDKNGIIKKSYALDPKIFVHPEGITFTPSGSLFISNEEGNMKPANILFYQYKK